MDKHAFRQHLLAATEGILPFTRHWVTNALPDECRYLVFPNCSYDGNPLRDDEEVFPQDSLLVSGGPVRRGTQRLGAMGRAAGGGFSLAQWEGSAVGERPRQGT